MICCEPACNVGLQLWTAADVSSGELPESLKSNLTPAISQLTLLA